MDSTAVLITIIFCIAFGAFATWVLMKKSNTKPPAGGGGGTSSDADAKPNKYEK